MKRFWRRHWMDVLIVVLFAAGLCLLVLGFLRSHTDVPDLVR